MHVEDMYTCNEEGRIWYCWKLGNYFYWKVLILDQNGYSVADASVTCEVLDPNEVYKAGATDATDPDGWADDFRISSGTNWDPGTYTINVTNVTHSELTYDPAANVIDSWEFGLQGY